MLAIYLDEDLSRHQLVWALRSRGFDVLTSFDAGMNGRNDESQLAFAAGCGRTLLSSNARDFTKLHREWLREGKTHAGIILVPQQRYSNGEIVRRLLRAGAAGVPNTSGLFYLSNF